MGYDEQQVAWLIRTNGDDELADLKEAARTQFPDKEVRRVHCSLLKRTVHKGEPALIRKDEYEYVMSNGDAHARHSLQALVKHCPVRYVESSPEVPSG